MGSLGAMEKGSKDRYFRRERCRQAGARRHRGPRAVSRSLGVIHQLAGGLRATMGYVGCATIEEMRKKPQFVITGAGSARATCTTCRSPNRRTTGG